jgi:hypothetical protein
VDSVAVRAPEFDDNAEPQEHRLSPPWTVIRTFGVEGLLRDDSDPPSRD